jgi:RNA polymerase sigma factor (sigma-70 family)
MNHDAELLRRYVEEGAEDAFAELVQRHVNLVYSVALRQLNGDAHLAADATQLVFTDLARKARAVAGHNVLAGWLFTSTRFAAAKLVRGERRRQARETEAHLMQDLTHDDPAAQLDWQRIRPVLDDVIGELSDNDREAILLRFFEGRDYASVGAQLNLAANAARMRVERALDKLRASLEERGVTSTTAAIATLLANQSVIAAPVGLAAVITGGALAGAGTAVATFGTASAAGAAAAATTFMSITKVQLGIAGALAAAAATGYVVQAESNSAVSDEINALRQQSQAIAPLRAENEQLRRAQAEVASLHGNDAELQRLREEAEALKAKLRTAARLQPARAKTAEALGTEPVYDISALDLTPRPKFQAAPSYPLEMRNSGTTGEVVVDFVVDQNGDVKNAYAARSSQREFESPAVEAVSLWKFAPGRKGGRDVVTHLQVPIMFTLSEEAKSGTLQVKSSEKKPEPPPGY